MKRIGPLQDPVTWCGINYAGTQVTQWDFQNKGTRTSPARLSFVLEVPLCNLRPSEINSVPCDRILQRAYTRPQLGQLPTTELVDKFDGFHSDKPPVDVLELSSLKYLEKLRSFKQKLIVIGVAYKRSIVQLLLMLFTLRRCVC